MVSSCRIDLLREAATCYPVSVAGNKSCSFELGVAKFGMPIRITHLIELVYDDHPFNCNNNRKRNKLPAYESVNPMNGESCDDRKKHI